jgi:hypothetical protein
MKPICLPFFLALLKIENIDFDWILVACLTLLSTNIDCTFKDL